MTVVVLAGRYELGDLIGRGGMADVHAAVDQRLERDVAVKVVRPGAAGADDLEARFADEARIAAQLLHPNVVSVFDTGTADDGRAFIVMERLPGDTLADRMRAGAMSEDEVRRIAEDVLGAMAAAHAAGIVHRDIKPGNVLMTEDGRAKIADFGIARESDTLLVDPTSTNALTGTPAYLAPERIEGKPATAQSDIWALGVVLYEALAGRKAFEGATPLAQAMAVRDGGAPPLAEVRPDVSPGLAATVTRAMAHEASDRFATAAQMAAALNHDDGATVVDDGATLVDGPTLVDGTVLLDQPATATASAGGSRRLWLAATAAGIAALIGIGVALAQPDGVPAEPASASVTTSTSPPPTTTVTTTAPVVRIGDDGIDVQIPARQVRRPKNKKGKD